MKARVFDPAEVTRACRDPLSWVSLSVDLLAVLAVLAFGWGVTPLVAQCTGLDLAGLALMWAALVAFAIRGGALKFGWSFPPYRGKPEDIP